MLTGVQARGDNIFSWYGIMAWPMRQQATGQAAQQSLLLPMVRLRSPGDGSKIGILLLATNLKGNGCLSRGGRWGLSRLAECVTRECQVWVEYMWGCDLEILCWAFKNTYNQLIKMKRVITYVTHMLSCANNSRKSLVICLGGEIFDFIGKFTPSLCACM